MPFDPNLPADSTPASAPEMREQLNSLRAEAAGLHAETARNPTAISTLGLTVSDPPTQAEVQAVASKLDELIGVLLRQG